MEFARIASGGSIGNTAVDYEDSGDYPSNSNKPVNSAENEIAAIFGTVGAGQRVTIESAFGAEHGKADGTHDGTSRHDDGEADEGLGESFLAFGNFAGVATRKGIEIATVDDVGNDQIGSNDCDIGEDIDSDLPDAILEGGLI